MRMRALYDSQDGLTWFVAKAHTLEGKRCSFATRGKHACTAAKTVSTVSVRKHAIFRGGPQKFFSHG
jgi:hypothetical protein